MKLTLVSIEKDGFIRVAVEGPITATDFPADSKNPMETLLGQTWSTMRVIINFGKTDYIDSSAIGWLISTGRVFREGGGAFVLHDVQQQVRQLLEVLRVGRVIPIADDESTARKIVLGQMRPAATGGEK